MLMVRVRLLAQARYLRCEYGLRVVTVCCGSLHRTDTLLLFCRYRRGCNPEAGYGKPPLSPLPTLSDVMIAARRDKSCLVSM